MSEKKMSLIEEMQTKAVLNAEINANVTAIGSLISDITKIAALIGWKECDKCQPEVVPINVDRLLFYLNKAKKEVKLNNNLNCNDFLEAAINLLKRR